MVQSEQLQLGRQALFALLFLRLLVATGVLQLLRLGKLEGKRLSRGLITATFRINTECPHLVLNLAQDLVGSRRALNSDILHIPELLSQVFLDCLDEQVQIADVPTAFFVAASASGGVDTALGIRARSLLHLLVLLAHAFLERFLLALIVSRATHSRSL